ncbi:MAG: alpha-ketoacid dehydrogenase subunit beta [Betaproteobacteria bacterium]|nr:alpha-ketoacid dehydrogenase subunit beta [Betaproteobacteria bacterium]
MKISFAEGLAKAIYESLDADPRVVLIGGGFMGLNIGARKLMEPAVQKFSDRILATPVSELALCGAATGAAVCGQRPVVDIGTGSFIFQAFAQVVNEAANIHYMSGGQSNAPVTFYCLAGMRGMGAAQHSHRMQAMLGQVPGLQILTPGSAEDAYYLMKWALLESQNPTVFISHSLLLAETAELAPGAAMVPVGKACIRKQGRDLSIIASSITVPRTLAAAEVLEREHGVSAEVVDLRTIVPLDRETVLQSVAKTGRAVIADECHRSFGVSAEIAATLAEEGLALLKAPVCRVAVPDVPIPFSPPLENELTVTKEKIVAGALKVLGR